jgi:hypothetical protein
MNPEADDADLLDQLRDVRDDDADVEPPSTLDTEADPADVTEQNQTVRLEDEEWSDG